MLALPYIRAKLQYMPRFQFLLPLLVIGLYGCGESSGPARELAAGSGFYLAMDSLRADYEAMRLPQALDRARKLGSIVETRDSVPDPLRAEVYQYLALLHFQHFVYVDSVNYYTQLAESLVNKRSHDTIRARQLLCAAYNGFEDWTWLDMQIQAQSGRLLMERAGEESSLLNALLLTIEARATKQYGDRSNSDPDRQKDAWAVSDDRYRAAIALLRSLGSPWERYAREQHIILLTRHPSNDPLIRKSVDTLRRLERQSTPYHAFTDRVLGYWHRKRGRADSSQYHYRRLLEYEPLFLAKRTSEARYALERYRLGENDFAGALRYSVDDMVRRSCCPEGGVPEHPDGILQCDRRVSCIHFISANAELYRRWYALSGEARHAEQAYAYALHSIDRYQRTFREFNEQSVHNKNLVLGDRLIASALKISTEIGGQVRAPREYHEAVFRAMELGKSILLSRELMQVAGHATDVGQREAARRLRTVEEEMKRLREAFTVAFTFPTGRLHRFVELREEARRLTGDFTSRQSSVVKAGNLPGAIPALSRVRKQLGVNEALIEFSETDSMLYVLYADRDTTAVHRLAAEPLRQSVGKFTAVLAADVGFPVADYAALSSLLYQSLFGPFTDLLEGRGEWILSPSASLAGLPFAALTDAEVAKPEDYGKLPYLVRKYDIRYIASWRAEQQYRGLRKRTFTRDQPVVGAWTHPELRGYLAATADHLLARTDPAGRHYRGQDCSSANLLSDAPAYEWLHLAVHATSNPARLHGNHLYFNSADSLDGIAIGRLVIPARLVVLAACSTSRGVARRWEGTYSLCRSFHRAGVPDVVTSLYDIPASATADLLEEFYDHLLDGCSPAAALSRAQRDFADGGLGSRRAWPGDWAGLVVG